LSDQHDQYNWIYKKLINGDDDVVGAIAYFLYKRQKVAFIEAYKAEHGSQGPDDAALKGFHLSTDNENARDGFRIQAETILTNFLNQVLSDQLKQATEGIKKSLYVQVMRDVEEKIRREIDLAKDAVNGEVRQISATLSERKGIFGWGRDILSNVLVNVITVIIIGAAVIGFGAFDTFNAFLKQAIERQGTQALGTKAPATESVNP
jgi:hypothetical protein